MSKVTEWVAEDSVGGEREGRTFRGGESSRNTIVIQFPLIIRLLHCAYPLFHLVSWCQPVPRCHFALKGARVGGEVGNGIFGRDPVSR